MSTAFFGLNTALRGLVASQLALDTVAHNTANASTPGYSRQRVEQVAAPAYQYPTAHPSGMPGQVGTGVNVLTLDRVRDAFMDLQLRAALPLQGNWDARSDQLGRVESVFPEPSGSGLGTVLNRFWDASEGVASNPTSGSARIAFVEAASDLAARFSRDGAQLKAVTDGIDGQVADGVTRINDLAKQIAAINLRIADITNAGDHPNDLSDQRDVLLDQLTAIVPTTLVPESNGTVTVLVGGIDLVNNGSARTLSATRDVSGKLLPTWTGGGAVALGEGQLAGLVAVRDGEIAGYRASLDDLAKGVADAVNAAHVSGYDQTGAPGTPLFSYTAGDVASTLRVSAAIVADPRLVAAAGAPGQAGNAAVARQIADLRTAQLFASGTQTAAQRYGSLITSIGSDARRAAETSQNQGLVVEHLQQRREATNGVSLDEEATDMIRFQHAYQASARVMSMYNDILDTIINLGK